MVNESPNTQTAQPQGERRYQRLQGVEYDRVNEFIRGRTWLTAREWAVASLVPAHRADTGVEVTKLGERAPEVIPFIEDELSPGNVGQTRTRIEEKVRKSVATAVWALAAGVVEPDEVKALIGDGVEIAKFMLEVEGAEVPVGREAQADQAIIEAVREVNAARREADRDDA